MAAKTDAERILDAIAEADRRRKADMEAIQVGLNRLADGIDAQSAMLLKLMEAAAPKKDSPIADALNRLAKGVEALGEDTQAIRRAVEGTKGDGHG